MESSLLFPAAGALAVYIVYRALRFFFRHSPLSDVRGPNSRSLLFGHQIELRRDHDEVLTEQWLNEYGHVVSHKGMFGSRAVITTDLRAIQYVLSHPDTFRKSSIFTRMLRRTLGDGVLIVEGAPHRAQCRVLNPAFGPVQVRELSGIFLDKANELRDVWTAKLVTAGGKIKLNIVDGLSAATLDIIGLAGFGYAFDALARSADNPSELSAAMGMFIGRGSPSMFGTLLMFLPGAKYLPTRAVQGRRKARAIMERIGRELLQERKAAAMATGKADAGGRDLLSLLVRANMSENTAQRLSDDEVIAQIPTFIVAGHETTSTATTWALFELAQHPAIRARLRAELRAAPLPTGARENEPLDADALAALDRLPLLDAVVRETLRLRAPVQRSVRVAAAPAVIPLASPFVDRHGVQQDVLRVAAGDEVTVPILAVQRSTALWGADAREWNPDRWLSGTPDATHAVPGIWGHLLSFLAGPHACIGYRFSLLETKILLHALVTTFNFELAIPVEEIVKGSGLVTRPTLRNMPQEGTQMPLVLSLADVE